VNACSTPSPSLAAAGSGLPRWYFYHQSVNLLSERSSPHGADKTCHTRRRCGVVWTSACLGEKFPW